VSHIDCTYNITHIKIYNIKQSIPSHRIDLRDTFIYTCTNIHLAISEIYANIDIECLYLSQYHCNALVYENKESLESLS